MSGNSVSHIDLATLKKVRDDRARALMREVALAARSEMFRSAPFCWQGGEVRREKCNSPELTSGGPIRSPLRSKDGRSTSPPYMRATFNKAALPRDKPAARNMFEPRNMFGETGNMDSEDPVDLSATLTDCSDESLASFIDALSADLDVLSQAVEGGGGLKLP